MMKLNTKMRNKTHTFVLIHYFIEQTNLGEGIGVLDTKGIFVVITIRRFSGESGKLHVDYPLCLWLKLYEDSQFRIMK